MPEYQREFLYILCMLVVFLFVVVPCCFDVLACLCGSIADLVRRRKDDR